MLSRVLSGLSGCGALLAAADVRGTISINRKLTHRTVTAPAGLYQHGAAVDLGRDREEDPIAFERSHVAVYLEAALSPSTGSGEPQMEQRERQFAPDLLVIPRGATVSFPNFDPIFHNVFSLSKAKSFDLGNYAKGDTRRVTFSSPGLVAVYCHLHPNMSATIVVAPSAFATRADRDGNFVLKDVPPGTYTLVAWHKSAGTFHKSVVQTAAGASEVNFVLPYVEPNANDHVARR